MTKEAVKNAMKIFSGGKRDPNEPKKKSKTDQKDLRMVRMKSEPQYNKYKDKTATASNALARAMSGGYPAAIVKKKRNPKSRLEQAV